MKIFFCDACNESIPHKDFSQHRITIEGGKLFCPKCAPIVQEKQRSVPAALVTTVLLLVMALIGMGFWGWQLIDDLRSDLRRAEFSLADVGNVAGVTATRLEAALVSLQNSEASLAELKGAVAALRDSSQQRYADLDRRLGADSDAARAALEERIGVLDAKTSSVLTDLRTQTQSTREDLAGQKAGLDGLKAALEVVRELAATKPLPVVGPVAPTDAGVAAPLARNAVEEREVNVLLLQLSDSDPGQRYTAVTELGRYSGTKVVAALEGMLKDAEEYLRVAVVQNLRRLGSKPSLPLILQVLRDGDPFVRSAAKAAFEELAGTRLNFDPEASPKDRESTVKEAESWWEANKVRVLSGT
ncbi:MAG: hypothetical protein EXS14_02725 [Planctomycetes bacterium]|nr:hypothetical protein [Planctomycetota bacterium]